MYIVYVIVYTVYVIGHTDWDSRHCAAMIACELASSCVMWDGTSDWWSSVYTVYKQGLSVS